MKCRGARQQSKYTLRGFSSALKNPFTREKKRILSKEDDVSTSL